MKLLNIPMEFMSIKKKIKYLGILYDRDKNPIYGC